MMLPIIPFRCITMYSLYQQLISQHTIKYLNSINRHINSIDRTLWHPLLDIFIPLRTVTLLSRCCNMYGIKAIIKNDFTLHIYLDNTIHMIKIEKKFIENVRVLSGLFLCINGFPLYDTVNGPTALMLIIDPLLWMDNTKDRIKGSNIERFIETLKYHINTKLHHPLFVYMFLGCLNLVDDVVTAIMSIYLEHEIKQVVNYFSSSMRRDIS